MSGVVLPAVFIVCLIGIGIIEASPPKTYDQRQQGELNIHAQLDNIVIVLVPSNNFNLLGLTTKNKYGEKPDKNEILQFFQKPHKGDIDRYGIVEDDNSNNDIKDSIPVVTAQQVIIENQEKNGDREEEVVATVEEMKPETTEKVTDTPKSEATEDSPIKEHSTISESIQESILKVSVPEDKKKDSIKPSDGMKESNPGKEFEIEKISKQGASKQDTVLKEQNAAEKTPDDDVPPTKEEHPTSLNVNPPQKPNETPSSEPEKKKFTIEDLIRPIAERKEENTHDMKSSIKSSAEESGATKMTTGLIEGVRKEKVIRYKPESKWAPGLVDILAPPRTKPTSRELEERQRFAGLCAPGTWDTELKTCIMPGETRSRNELARFLEAMRFGIAIPTPVTSQ